METYTVEILEPKAKKLLDDLANLNLIRFEKNDKARFKKLLRKIRETDSATPTLEEITREVEKVRQKRYAKK